jgi:bifunctional DNA-binding transcriptional regulator/antitoxin component of YhaV-PrlF toxin-antitoxin module
MSGAKIGGVLHARASKVTADRVVEAVLPSKPAGSETAVVVPFPLPSLVALPRDESLLYSMSRLGESGALPATPLLKALRWQTGDRIELRATPSVVILRRAEFGTQLLTRETCVVIPAAARRRCGMHSGDTVLLAAAQSRDVLVVHSLAAINDMVGRFHAEVRSDE